MPASFYWFWTNLKTTKEVVLDITAQLAPAMKPDQARWLHGQKRIDNSEQRLRSAVSRICSVKVICMIPCIEIIPLLYTSVLFFCIARQWMQPRRSADSSVSKLWTPDPYTTNPVQSPFLNILRTCGKVYLDIPSRSPLSSWCSTI